MRMLFFTVIAVYFLSLGTSQSSATIIDWNSQEGPAGIQAKLIVSEPLSPTDYTEVHQDQVTFLLGDATHPLKADPTYRLAPQFSMWLGPYKPPSPGGVIGNLPDGSPLPSTSSVIWVSAYYTQYYTQSQTPGHEWDWAFIYPYLGLTPDSIYGLSNAPWNGIILQPGYPQPAYIDQGYWTVAQSSVPVPGTFLLLGAGLAGIAAYRKKYGR